MFRHALCLITVPITLASLLLLASPSSASQTPDRLLVGATLIDGTGADAVSNAWVLLRGDRIEGVGQGEPPSAPDAQVMNLKGRTVVPGLADMHAHVGRLRSARWALKLLLAHGVTTVMDPANSMGQVAAIRRWLEQQETVPHFYAASIPLQGSYTEQRFLQRGGEIEMKMQDYAAFGLDFVKVYNWLSSDGLVQVGELSEKYNLPVTGHTPLSWTSVGAIDAGIKILQHLRLRPYEVIDDLEIIADYPVDGSLMRRTGYWAHLKPNGRNITQTLDLWEKRKDKFFVTPTLVVQEAVAESYDYPDPEFENKVDIKLVSPGMLSRFKKASPPKHWGDLKPEEIAEAKQSFEGMATFVGLAHARGIRILSGTDTPVPWLVPGASLHRELRHFVQKSGMTPEQAIHTSTGLAAEALETPDRGTIQKGKVADLVIVVGNLAEDLDALENIEHVILGGELHSREKLMKEVAEWSVHDPAEKEDEEATP